MSKPRIYTIGFADVYPLYVRKVEKKGRTADEVNQVITWLTGYGPKDIQSQIDRRIDFEQFFTEAPRLNADRSMITGVICGMRVEEIDDPMTQNIRYLDKLVDELARGKSMDKVLRTLR